MEKTKQNKIYLSDVCNEMVAILAEERRMTKRAFLEQLITMCGKHNHCSVEMVERRLARRKLREAGEPIPEELEVRENELASKIPEPLKQEPVPEAVNLRLTEVQRHKLKQKCNKLGMSVSRLLRLAVEGIVGKETELQVTIDKLVDKGSQLDWKKGAGRVHLRITERERLGIKHLMQKTGLSKNQVIMKTFRMVAFKEDLMSADEANEMHNIAHQVRSVGLNLNQIARALNTSLSNTDRFNAEFATGLERNLKVLAANIKGKLTSIERRWRYFEGCHE